MRFSPPLRGRFSPVPLLESAASTASHAGRLQYESLELFDVSMRWHNLSWPTWLPFSPALDPGTPGYVKALTNGCAGGEGR
jgi:hypothetical protein